MTQKPKSYEFYFLMVMLGIIVFWLVVIILEA